ncbi:MAG: hypothetical protein ABL888_13260 [Pirellulaceae bacterium]
MAPDTSAVDAYQMRRTRALLAEQPELRWEAIPSFVLSVASACSDLQKFAEMRRSGVKLSPEAIEAARYIEDMIRCRYREIFGAESPRRERLSDTKAKFMQDSPK